MNSPARGESDTNRHVRAGQAMNLSELSTRHGPSVAVAVATLFGALREGDRIAIRGAENLTDGAAVRIVLSNTAGLEEAVDDG